MSEPLIRLAHVTKSFVQGEETITVLREVCLDIEKGASVAIVGASGSGKSTLLHLIAGLDTPSSGRILFQGRDISKLNEMERARMRGACMGFVFQFHHLLPEFTTLENVAMPALIAGTSAAQAMARARECLEDVGLGHRLHHRVTTLSGGERQRAAIARALLQRPQILLADEPTGNLDARTGESIHELMLRLNAQHGMTLIVVTHNAQLAASMRTRWELRAGELYAA
ncbi:lipoprotein-releasing system ATP-binding protein LolD [Thermodesulfomicrobium sp. WS]|uniref:ABC transporter ATP-binding protein n=1 Tax=Thermodesulfomicrobium sp. WS TaxID=3004129 RepID=UPI0024928FEC|nr:ABC transporter ATP-binding protein [Thermodesulfomicrobium sp. WS]BDV01686.1 lipoprotein-releasing system ATP-binding protein LolD [Thermodesulfomicrobium sp. WS]